MPIGAIYNHYSHNSDSSDDLIKITEELYIRCGVCTGQYPKEAITMVRIKEEILVERTRGIIIEFEK